ncbi:Protein phosphatase 1 regulatory subunit 12A [Nymphon striatum]|nr:Protein phosphatase 1 regulatory subunit 12A [Nymphon striatum]
MMEGRSTSAVTRRAEQLKRWEESETNKDCSPESRKSPKIRFTDGCVFLAACASADTDEVKKRLEENKTDIDTANIDGLTALHQACIDDNLDMVEFLVEHGSDINCGDNEGWTPLHATASCGFLSIARYLIDSGADVAAVNNDGDLPIDIAESDDMEEWLQSEINKQNIDCDKARNAEEKIMLQDVQECLKNKSVPTFVHEKTGASALHVAAAKGYIKVMSMLIDAGANLDAQDFDGWAPLHAAAHWCQREALELLKHFDQRKMPEGVFLLILTNKLVRSLVRNTLLKICKGDLGIGSFHNRMGQTAFDVADPDVLPLLEEIKRKQATEKKNKKGIENLIKKNDPPPLKRRTSVTRMSVTDKSNVVMKDASAERAALLKHPENLEEAQSHVRIEETIEEVEPALEEENEINDKKNQINKLNQIDIIDDIIQESQNFDKKEKDEQIKLKQDRFKQEEIQEKPKLEPISLFKSDYCISHCRNLFIANNLLLSKLIACDLLLPQSTISSSSPLNTSGLQLRLISWQTGWRSSASSVNEDTKNKVTEESAPQLWRRTRIKSDSKSEDKQNQEILPSTNIDSSQPTRVTSASRTNRNCASWNLPTITNTSLLRSASYPTSRYRNSLFPNDTQSTAVSTVTSSVSSVTLSTSSPVTSPTMVTTSLPYSSNNVRRSMVPPVRDDESETQRRAHAKRVRETRRSTQGVTLEDLKSAEQQFLRKQQEEDEKKERENERVKATETTDSEKRTSWRQRYQQLQDDNCNLPYRHTRDTNTTSTSSNSSNMYSPSVVTSTVSPTPVSSATVTVPLRAVTTPKSDENGNKDFLFMKYTFNSEFTDKLVHQINQLKLGKKQFGAYYKDNEENESEKNAHGSQAVIIRRRRPKRRSTGVVLLDLDDGGTNSNKTNVKSDDVTPEDKNKLKYSGSSQSLASTESEKSIPLFSIENGTDSLDYKKLYEEVKEENERLKENFSKTELALKESRDQLEKVLQERRALERKLSEMEEEVKQMELLKLDNAKYRDENGALIRVISKLSK